MSESNHFCPQQNCKHRFVGGDHCGGGGGVLVDLVDVRSESEIQNPSSSCWFPSRPSQGALAIKLQAQCTALGENILCLQTTNAISEGTEFLCLMQYRWAEFLCLMQCHRSTVVCTCREFQLEFLQYLRQLPQGSLIGKKVKGGKRQNEKFWAQTWDSFEMMHHTRLVGR